MRIYQKQWGWMVCVLLLCLTTLGVQAQAQQKQETFTFAPEDLKLLEQANLLDGRLEKDGLVYGEEALGAYLTRMGNSLVPEGKPPEHVTWRFRVLRDPLANAFALPQGSIYVTTGLLSLLENESQLASVLAHEITHVLNRHNYLAQRSYRKKMVAIHIFQAAGAVIPVGSIAGATISVIASIAPYILVATMQGYSRELEQEADMRAVSALMETDHDPREMATTFQLLQKSDETELIKVYYNDHPKLQERINYINQFLQSKSAPTFSAEALQASRARYLPAIETVAQHNVQLELESGRFRTAIALSQKLVAFHPQSAKNLFCLAEAYRSLGPRAPTPKADELTGKGMKDAKKLKQKMTLQEEENVLLATEPGKTEWQANQVKAEEFYRKALALDPNHAPSQRGLGLLYEKMQKPQAALEAFRKYLELQPDAPDRLRIQRRIEALEKQVQNPNQTPGL